jgi:hypothetical protein
MMIDHPVLALDRRGASGFTLKSAGQAPVRVALESPLAGWILRRHGGEHGQFRLLDVATGVELGCTLSLGGVGQRQDLRYFLLGDGRLFRLIMRGPAEAGYDLTGWETPGAYLKARACGTGWQILPTPASGGIEDVLVLAVLLGAEILDAEEPLVCATES